MPGDPRLDKILTYLLNLRDSSRLDSLLWNVRITSDYYKTCHLCGRHVKLHVMSWRRALCVDCYLKRYPDEAYDVLYVVVRKFTNRYRRNVTYDDLKRYVCSQSRKLCELLGEVEEHVLK